MSVDLYHSIIPVRGFLEVAVGSVRLLLVCLKVRYVLRTRYMGGIDALNRQRKQNDARLAIARWRRITILGPGMIPAVIGGGQGFAWLADAGLAAGAMGKMAR